MPDAPGASVLPYTEGEGEVSALLSGADVPGDPSLKAPGAPSANLPDATMPSMPDAPAFGASVPSVGSTEHPAGGGPTIGLDAAVPGLPGKASLPDASGMVPEDSAKLGRLPGELPEASLSGALSAGGTSASLPSASASAPKVDVGAPEAPGAPEVVVPGSSTKKKSKFSLPSFMSPSSRKAKKEAGASGKLPLMAMGMLSFIILYTHLSCSRDFLSMLHARCSSIGTFLQTAT